MSGRGTGLSPEVLLSEIDQSVNFVTRGQFPGLIEARYVSREDSYLIAYLSSQTGCNKACRFCHLTQSGQTLGRDVTIEEYIAQAEQVLRHYDELIEEGRRARAESVHYNFMSRGEVFANRHVLDNAPELITGLVGSALRRDLVPRLKFSSIFPGEVEDLELVDLFGGFNPNVYYSLYSVDPSFRRRWMPKALPPEVALGKLARWQRQTRKIPVLHWAFIEGENDSVDSIEMIIEAVRESGLRPDFNVVRYNPYSPGQGREPSMDVIERNARLLAEGVPGSRIKIVGRVGFDVKASCGMFVPGTHRGMRELAA